MKGSLCHELEVDLPADDVWGLYGTMKLAELVVRALPDIIQKFDVVEGDGGVGTVLHLTFPPGSPGAQFYREKFVKVDDKSRVKEAMVTDGGLLELGFSSYITRFEIAERGSSSCTIKSTIEYEVDEEHVANASFVTVDAFAAIAKAAAEHLIEHRSCVAN